MPAILIGILSSVIGGESIGAVLAALSLDQWLTLAVGAAALEPSVARMLGGNHPSLDQLVEQVGKGVESQVIAKAMDDFFANQSPTISGYGPDGAVIAIPNPDYRG